MNRAMWSIYPNLLTPASVTMAFSARRGTGRTYLLYCGGGESGIGIAEVLGLGGWAGRGKNRMAEREGFEPSMGFRPILP